MERLWRRKWTVVAGTVVAATTLYPWASGSNTAPTRFVSTGQKGTIRVVTDDATGRGLVLVWHGEEGNQQRVATEDRAGTKTGERVLTFDCRPGVYVLHAPDMVSAPITLNETTCGSSQVMTLLPAAAARGLIAQINAGAPAVVPFSVRRCGVSGPAGDIGEYSAAVNRDRSFHVVLPAGCLDVMITPRGFAPVRIPSMTLAFRQLRDVGQLMLKPGATLFVRTTSSEGKALPGVLVSVLSAEQFGPFVKDALLRNNPVRLSYEARSDEHGGATFVGIPADVVYLITRIDGRTGFGGPVQLRDGRLSAPDPITPVAAGSIRVVTAGETDWIPPGGTLSVSATPQVCGQWIESAMVWSDLSKQMESTTLVPFAGHWRIQLFLVESGRGDLIDAQEADVPAGGEALVPFSTARIAYEGRVIVGGRTFSGRLTVVPDIPGSVAEFTAEVDQAGTFRIWLPSPGTYAARFRDARGTMALKKATAEFAAGVQTTIRFEVSSQVSGVVVLSDGSPVAGASVRAELTLGDITLDAIRLGPAPMVNTDAGGRFLFQNLEYGSWEILATWNGRAAAPQTVDVGPNMPTGPVRLVLGDSDTLTGRVVDAVGEPVPGARGRFGVETGNPTSVPPGGIFSTDTDGYFRMKVGPYIRHVI